MSYDLAVFDLNVTPTDRKEFLEWFEQQTQWGEDHDYNHPEVTTPELRAWFFEIIKEFPPMNGPYAVDDPDNLKVSDYSIGKSIIYVAFAWSQCASARYTMFSLAEKHRIGFFDVSETDGGVWVPDSNGKYTCIHGGVKDKKWWQFWK